MLLRWLAIGLLIGMQAVQAAPQEVRIGVLAFRPKPQTEAQWVPLGEALTRVYPEYRFRV